MEVKIKDLGINGEGIFRFDSGENIGKVGALAHGFKQEVCVAAHEVGLTVGGVAFALLCINGRRHCNEKQCRQQYNLAKE